MVQMLLHTPVPRMKAQRGEAKWPHADLAGVGPRQPGWATLNHHTRLAPASLFLHNNQLEGWDRKYCPRYITK